jgi:hypothetical protein
VALYSWRSVALSSAHCCATQMPYVMDLHLFLSRPVLFNTEHITYTASSMTPGDVHCGTFPRRVLDAEVCYRSAT